MKKISLRILLITFFIVLVWAINVEATDTSNVYVTGTLNYEAAYKVLDIVNEEREAEGLGTLTMDESLLETAMQRAAEISIYYSHDRPNGNSCFTANSKMVAENIAAWQGNATSVMNSWMNSTGHKDNILGSSYTKIGIGCFYINGHYYWVQCFGKGTATEPTEIASNTSKTMTVEVASDYVSLSMDTTDETIIIGDTASSRTVKNINTAWTYISITLEYPSVTWTSSNENIATVDAYGKVTGVGLRNGNNNLQSGRENIIIYS